MKVKLHPQARVDLKEGKTFYQKRSPLAAVAFAHQVDQAIARIREAPLRYRPGDDGTREHVLPSRFPYTIVYRVTGETILIIAIAHQNREPDYWHDRR